MCIRDRFYISPNLGLTPKCDELKESADSLSARSGLQNTPKCVSIGVAYDAPQTPNRLRGTPPQSPPHSVPRLQIVPPSALTTLHLTFHGALPHTTPLRTVQTNSSVEIHLFNIYFWSHSVQLYILVPAENCAILTNLWIHAIFATTRSFHELTAHFV